MKTTFCTPCSGDIVPSPIQEIQVETFARQGLRLLIKRDDLIHPQISGNKWRKLKYNLLEAKQLGYRRLLTFGGAYSNHLAALAAAGEEFGFSTLGIVRGERQESLNPTLGFVEKCGMKLVFTRGDFKDPQTLLETLNIDSSGYFVLPMGGANCHALQGCREIVSEIDIQLGGLPDFICVPCGTGTTMAGLLAGLDQRKTALGIAALKGDFLQKAVRNLIEICGEKDPGNWQILNDYHFGGYAKFNEALISFINHFKRRYEIPLDPIYTGKLFFGIFDLAEKGYFPRGSTILAVHTGGLQGNQGFIERYGNLIE